MFTIRRLRQPEHTTASTRRAAMLGAILASGVLAMPASGQARPVSNTTSGAPAVAATPSVEAIRAATERFRDVRVALAEGYLRDPASMCVTAAMEGMPRQLGEKGTALRIPYFCGTIPGCSYNLFAVRRKTGTVDQVSMTLKISQK